jgi:O-antigen/teichoic acid export membrane protein
MNRRPIDMEQVCHSRHTFLQRAVRNFLFSGLGTVSNLTLGLLFAGLTIRYLGEARAGYFLALAALTGLNAILGDFGLGVPAIRRVAALNAKGDLGTARKVVGSVCAASLASGLVIAVSIISCFPVIFKWTRLTPELRSDAFWAMLFTLGSFVLSQASSSWRSTYNALERYDLISIFDTISGLLFGVCGIGILLVVPTMGALAAVRLILSLARFLTDAWFVRRLLSGTVWPIWEWSIVRPLLGFGGWVYIGNLGNLLFGRLNSLILTTFSGSVALPSYELPQRFYTQAHAALGNQSQFLFPMLASYGEETAAQIHRLEDRLRWFIAVASGAVYCAFASLGPESISIIVNPTFAEKVRILIYMACIQGFFQAQDIVPYFTSHAMGLGRPNSMVQLGQGLCVTGTALFLIPRFGALGAGAAQLWVAPMVILHLVWVQRQVSPHLPRFGWATSYISPLAMIFAWLTLVRFVRHLLHPSLLTTCLSTLAGTAAGFLTLLLIETVFYKESQRLATLNRITAFPFRRILRVG